MAVSYFKYFTKNVSNLLCQVKNYTLIPFPEQVNFFSSIVNSVGILRTAFYSLDLSQYFLDKKV